MKRIIAVICMKIAFVVVSLFASNINCAQRSHPTSGLMGIREDYGKCLVAPSQSELGKEQQ